LRDRLRYDVPTDATSSDSALLECKWCRLDTGINGIDFLLDCCPDVLLMLGQLARLATLATLASFAALLTLTILRFWGKLATPSLEIELIRDDTFRTGAELGLLILLPCLGLECFLAYETDFFLPSVF
jgi:hypothetical protein